MSNTKDGRRMNHGVKIAQSDVDIKRLDSEKPKTQKHTLAHILYMLALPYFYGAKAQVDRYKLAAATLQEQPVASVQTCLHEISCLFEDLATVSKYAELCGHTHELHSLWFDARNHIRHDVREEFDNESDARKNARARRLGLNEKLQTNIGFEAAAIKVGGTRIEIVTIEDYLAWAENVIDKVLKDAQDKGLIE